MSTSRGTPIGIFFLQKCFRLGKYRGVVYQSSVWLLTFIAYTVFHLSRRPLAVVKNSLNQDCSKLVPPIDVVITNETSRNWCNWAPFDQDDANWQLGLLDSVYLFAYAICMFINGVVAERMDLRYFLALGILLSGFFTSMFGLAYYMDIHSSFFFIIVQIFAGAVQSTGWPGVVSCIGNWFGKGRRGLIFGIWNAHVYVGNIIGAYIAGYFVAYNWGLSFIVPGAITGVVGLVLYLFLVPHPEDVDCSLADLNDKESNFEKCYETFTSQNSSFLEDKVSQNNSLTESSSFTVKPNPVSVKHSKKKAITFWNALKIPGVLEFSLCLFFSKLVSYTFLFWLPRYISDATGDGSQASAYLSIVFDVGGILGGIAAGIISDHTGSSALTCVGFLGLAIPSLFAFQVHAGTSYTSNIILQLICGALVNGPYALITTAVSAELGTHKSIKNNSKALSTVTAIIDGTGSVGAALGPFIAGLVSEFSWSYVFYAMMLADFFALVSLLRTALKEVKHCYEFKCSFFFLNRRSSGYEEII